MEAFDYEINQVFVKLLDGKHKILNFNTPSIPVSTLKHRIQTLTSIPSHLQLLLSNNSRVLRDHQLLHLTQSRDDSPVPEALDLISDCRSSQNQEFSRLCSSDWPKNPAGFNGSKIGLGKFPVVVHLLLRLKGGKGGFGSLLRGAATKAGQKKTNNFDACRDMSGRRLRHVNAEKKLEEWRAEAEERKLEKMAEDFLKKKMKEVAKSGKSIGGDSSEKYVAKYREDSAKCMEEVERSVRESIKGLVDSKRKSGSEGSESASKRLKIWLGKKKIGDSDSEDTDDDDSDEEEDENEKSIIIDNGSLSDSSKEAEASSGSITGGKLDDGSLDQGSPKSGSEKEDTAPEEFLKYQDSDGCDDIGGYKYSNNNVLQSLEENNDHNETGKEVSQEYHSSKVEEMANGQLVMPGSKEDIASVVESRSSVISEPVQEEPVSVNVNAQDLNKPLNLDEYQSATELQGLGVERLKLELQARGLKCGGTLQERAARLFLLKTTPLEMLPKKLFAKK